MRRRAAGSLAAGDARAAAIVAVLALWPRSPPARRRRASSQRGDVAGADVVGDAGPRRPGRTSRCCSPRGLPERPRVEAQRGLLARARRRAPARRCGVLRGHTGIVQTVSWSADGKTLLSAGSDNTIRRWERTDASPARPGGSSYPATQRRRSAPTDGRSQRAAAGHSSSATRGLDGRIGSSLPEEDPVSDVWFDPAGRRLATVDFTGTVHLWDLRDRRRLAVRPPQGGLRAYGAGVRRAGVRPPG